MLTWRDLEIFEVGIVKDYKSFKLNFLKQKTNCHVTNNFAVNQSGCQSR